jgi:hypothetical protein
MAARGPEGAAPTRLELDRESHLRYVSVMPAQGSAKTPDAATPDQGETFNPWSVVHLVFDHLVANGLHPVLGETGDPSQPATDLLRALGVEPGPERPGYTHTDVSQQLAELRAAVLGGQTRDDAGDDL